MSFTLRLIYVELESLTQASKYRPTSPPAHTHPHRHHVQRPTTPGQAVTYFPRLQNDRPNAKVYEGKAEMDGGNSTGKFELSFFNHV